jgi:hypothetical protein
MSRRRSTVDENPRKREGRPATTTGTARVLGPRQHNHEHDSEEEKNEHQEQPQQRRTETIELLGDDADGGRTNDAYAATASSRPGVIDLVDNTSSSGSEVERGW